MFVCTFATVVVLALIGLFVSLLRKYKKTQSDFNYPPGPYGVPLFGFMPFLAINPPKILYLLGEWYGNIISFYLGKYRIIVLNDFTSIKDAFKEEVFSGRPNLKMLEVRNGGIRQGLVCSEGKDWVEQRKFTIRQLRDFGFGKQSMECLVQEEVDELIKNLEQFSTTRRTTHKKFTILNIAPGFLFRQSTGTSMELHDRFNTSVLNALWRIICGERYSQDDDRMQKILEMTGADLKETKYTGPVLFLPWLIDIAPSLTRWNDFTHSIKSVHKFLRDIIEQHKATLQPHVSRDFIDSYLNEIQSTTDPTSSFFGEKGEHSLLIVLLDLFMAGADTTSTTLLWAFLYLALYPTVQAKVQQEIDSIVGRKQSPNIQNRNDMPYTQATIMEILRKSSLVPFGLFHSCTERTQFHGFDIPKDSVIMANLHNVHNNGIYWGDADNFRPERFLDGDNKIIKIEAFIPFSIGKRVCPGEHLAKNQLFLFIAGLLQKYTFNYDPSKGKPSLTPIVGVVLSPKPYSVIVQNRK